MSRARRVLRWVERAIWGRSEMADALWRRARRRHVRAERQVARFFDEYEASLREVVASDTSVLMGCRR